MGEFKKVERFVDEIFAESSEHAKSVHSDELKNFKTSKECQTDPVNINDSSKKVDNNIL